MLYRKDIDGLRAIAVLAVIAFHFGYFANGYLGVDIFFVISGYLITGILFKEVQEQQFSIKAFYLRRIRRIIPLVLLVNLAVLITGLL
ncbi:MAG: acyltransferase, partial [Chitinophagaceae bacterium]|nr:acyltransferase [Chitinophagaceae bacterium]